MCIRDRLDAGRIEGMAKGIRELIDLDDPAGKVLRTVERPNGIVIEKTAVPMGVIAIIYESRPNVTSDAAALCIKSGNVCVLRSGKEAWKSCLLYTSSGLSRFNLTSSLCPSHPSYQNPSLYSVFPSKLK